MQLLLLFATLGFLLYVLVKALVALEAALLARRQRASAPRVRGAHARRRTQ